MIPWHDSLLARGAKFDGATASSFADPAQERAAARDGAVICDLTSLAALRVTGSDAEAFLQGQLTSDVAALAPGASQYSAWCSPKGRVLANFLLRRFDGAAFELLLPAVLLAPIRKRLGMFVLRSKVVLEDASTMSVRIGIGGPMAPRCAEAVAGTAPPIHRSAALAGGALLGLVGNRFVAIVPPESATPLWDRLTQHAQPAGFSCWQWLAVRAGVPVVLPPTQDLFIPQMLNWEIVGGVSFKKGCYTGQEIVARTQHLGSVKERTMLAHVDAAPPTPGTRVFSERFGEQACGTVINAAPAPEAGSDLLAVMQTAAIAGDLRLGARDGPPLSPLALPYDTPAAVRSSGRAA
jgi:folate-binding protein YgfZ